MTEFQSIKRLLQSLEVRSRHIETRLSKFLISLAGSILRQNRIPRQDWKLLAGGVSVFPRRNLHYKAPQENRKNQKSILQSFQNRFFAKLACKFKCFSRIMGIFEGKINFLEAFNQKKSFRICSYRKYLLPPSCNFPLQKSRKHEACNLEGNSC